MALRAHRRAVRRESGFTLVEILVGVVIALIAVLVIFQVFAVSEGIKRNTTGIGDAQQTGLFASFALGQEIINAGSGVATAIQELNSCPDTGDIATTQRPISVVITDSGSIDKPDSMVINYAVSARLVVPATFTRNSAPGDDFWIQSPNGILVGDRIVAVAPNGYLAGQCAVATVTAVGAPDALGVVQVSYTPAAGVTFSQNSVMFNYGPAASAQRVRYDVSADTLRSLDLYNAAAAPVPLASNIVNLKLQYGIDTDNNGYLDTWVSAKGDWAPDKVLVARAETLNQIKAVRMAIVVRSEQFDKDAKDWKPPQPLLFECGTAKCDDPSGGYDITIPAVTSPPGNFRYRVYENVVPIRNGIWNFVKG